MLRVCMTLTLRLALVMGSEGLGMALEWLECMVVTHMCFKPSSPIVEHGKYISIRGEAGMIAFINLDPLHVA